MEIKISGLFIINYLLYCHAASLRQQLDHILRRRSESLGISPFYGLLAGVPADIPAGLPTRRLAILSKGEEQILGAPDTAAHLPIAEPILPGHTLIRPAFGMLKSALSFPHKDLEDGNGVYGNFNMLSLRWGSRYDRVHYTEFRRANGKPPPPPPLSVGDEKDETKLLDFYKARLRILGMLPKPTGIEDAKLHLQILGVTTKLDSQHKY